MFGKRKQAENVVQRPEFTEVVEDETPDLVVDVPKHSEEENVAENGSKQELSVGNEPKSEEIPVEKPKQEKVEKDKETMQIVGAELLSNGLFQYKVITNNKLGELGQVFYK